VSMTDASQCDSGGAPPSRAVVLAMMLGMTFFWPIATYRISPDLFLPGVEPLFHNQMTLGGIVQPLLVVAFGAAVFILDISGKQHVLLERGALLSVEAVLLATLLANGLVGGALGIGAMVVVLSAAYTALLARAWATSVGFLSLRLITVIFTTSAFGSVVVSSVVQAFPLVPWISRSGSTVLLTFLSGAIWSLLPEALRVGAGAGQRPVQGSRMLMANIAREPVFAALVILVVFTLTTSALRVLFSFDDGGEFLYKSAASKVVAMAIAAVMLIASAWITRPTRNDSPCEEQGDMRFPWGLFAAICLASLYVTIIVSDYAPVLCEAAVFPCRLYAFMLTWLVAVALSRHVDSTGRMAGPYVCIIWTAALCASRIVSYLAFLSLGSFRDSGANFLAQRLLIPAAVVAAALTTAATMYYVATNVLKKSASKASDGVAESGPRSGASDRDAAIGEIARRCGLTERESQVVDLLSMGYSYKRVAEELCLSTNTVTSYVRTIYRKLEVHERQEVIDLVESTMMEGGSAAGR
jgi:DNA-binding CsgD family transcriptional regulator